MQPPLGARFGGLMLVIIVTLPWPDKRLMPNAKRRSHWSAYRGAIRDARTTAFALTRSAMGRLRFAAPPAMVVSFTPPDARRRDDDGMIGAFKHGRDGIADALGIDDRHLRPTYSFDAPARPGRIIVTLTGEVAT
ncbi:endodeoxyribonuclease RusA [Frigidibacter oleivorans]|uniref:endodeoxyribonuclease RusA n=1 Tax=Frigidibacter oleivorans TaxID=2487129 RepID=UPI0013DFAF8D|nr:endodeoxyribonuclease RusA [Frigidibacter oleivorans]